MNTTGILTTPERRQAFVDRYEVPPLTPLDPELLKLLDLPDDLPDRLSIAEAAEVTGLTAHTLRHYERIGFVHAGRDRDRAVLAARARDADRHCAADVRAGGRRLPSDAASVHRRQSRRANLALVDEIRTVAARYDATPGQVALAWVLAQGNDVAPIPGTKRRRYLEENARALDLDLSSDDVVSLGKLTPVGTRYPDMTWVDRSTALLG